MHFSKTILSLAALCTVFCTSAFADELIPGYLTDPTGNWKETTSDGYRTPEHLKYPYVSTYYINPTYTVGDTVKISCYVTDFDHSLVRAGDDSKRFDVTCRLTSNCGTNFTRKVISGIKSGDVEFNLGQLPEGEYIAGFTSTDLSRKLDSHTVWQEFRVVKKGALDIPESKTFRINASILAKYGIKADPGRERLVKIELDEDPAKRITNYYTGIGDHTKHYLAIIDKYLAEHPHQDAKGAPGYVVYVPTWKGVGIDRAYQRCRVVYDKNYDKDAVAAEAEANSAGLQRLVAEAWTNGFRKIVFAPGTYRVSHKYTLTVPDHTTIDMNGATLKLNGHIGCKSLMAKIAAVTDAHLLNGTLEGDYWEHDYAAPDSKSSEWVCGTNIRSMCRYCSIENVTVRYITGYGLVNGTGNEGPGHIVRGKPFLNVGDWISLGGKKSGLEPGGLNAKGEVDASDTFQWTTPYHDISSFLPWKYLTVNKALGYQGVRTRSWNYVACFYDAEKKFISRTIAFQYRHVLIPRNAKFARFSIEVQGEKEAKENDLSLFMPKAPRNCAYKNCFVDRARAVGIAVNNMNNFLFEGNTVRQSGECLATCALDAEDGWDGMQDALFIHNDMTDNHRNQFLTCAGHNFMIVSNKFNISLHGRTFSSFVKDNVSSYANFECRNRTRTGYFREEGNVCNSLSIGDDRKSYDGWDIVVHDRVFSKDDPKSAKKISCGPTGRYRNCTFNGVVANVGSAEKCVFMNCRNDLMRWRNGRWTDCRAENCTIERYACTNAYINCSFPGTTFKSLAKSPQIFTNCNTDKTTFSKNAKEQCRFEK